MDNYPDTGGYDDYEITLNKKDLPEGVAVKEWPEEAKARRA